MEEQDIQLDLGDDLIAVEDGLDAITGLNDIANVVETQTDINESDVKLIKIATEAFIKQTGLTQLSIANESFPSASAIATGIRDRVMAIIKTLKDAVAKIIQKFKDFMAQFRRYTDLVQRDLDDFRIELSRKNLLNLVPKQYKTNAVKFFVQNRKKRSNVLTGKSVRDSLINFQSRKFENNRHDVLKEVLKSFTNIVGKIKSGSVEEEDIDVILQKTFACIFENYAIQNSFVPKGNQGHIHRDTFPLYHDEDELYSSYTISSPYKNISFPCVEIVMEGTPYERQAIIDFEDGSIVNDVFEQLVKIKDHSFKMLDVLDSSEKFLNDLNKSFDGLLKIEKSEDLAIKVVAAKDMMKSLEIMNKLVTALMNRNNKIVTVHLTALKYAIR
jgi:cellobiose-specific phosphotransferase system component IIA